jgi:hypothetical protein
MVEPSLFATYSKNQTKPSALHAFLRNTIGKQTTNLENQCVRQLALRNKAIGPKAFAFVCERKAVELGEDDDAQSGKRLAELPGGFQAVQPRHAEIEQGEIGLMAFGQSDGVHAVLGSANHLEASGEFEIFTDGAQCGWRVVRNQDADEIIIVDHSDLQPFALLLVWMMRKKGGEGN